MIEFQEAAPVDMDDLLSSDPALVPVPEAEEEAEVIEETETVQEAEETPAQRRIRELEAALAEPDPVYEDPEETEEERRIKELEDLLAKKRAARLENAPTQYEAAGSGEKILIHFVEDGFTFGGRVWFRGQEVEFEVGSKAHLQQKDRSGASWLDLADDPMAQVARFGKHYFSSGPWKGRPWGDLTGLTNEQDIVNAQNAARAEARRNRAAPVI